MELLIKDEVLQELSSILFGLRDPELCTVGLFLDCRGKWPSLLYE